MFEFKGFTEKASTALNLSITSAEALGNEYVGSEHIVLGLLKEGTGVAFQALDNLGVTAEGFEKLLRERVGTDHTTSLTPEAFTPRSKQVLHLAEMTGAKMNTPYVGTEHLLMAIMEDESCFGMRFLQIMRIGKERIAGELSKLLNDPNLAPAPPQSAAPRQEEVSRQSSSVGRALSQFGRDLTQLAAEGKIDPVIGREEEIQRVIQILSRRTKNNPVLIGEPGVGKTAVAEGLALLISRGDVPETLKGKHLFSLDINGMVAGTKFRGDFEERIKNAIDEVKASGDVIIFIDELHTIIGAGGNEGSSDAANILKPALARGDFQVIGATTINEYRKYIEKDAALERRFQPVTVGEPSEDETIAILKGLKDRYEAHHKVQIPDETIVAAVTLSSRYISDRFLPDKAIDLIDEAASRVRLRTFTAPESLQDLEKAEKELESEKAAAISAQDFERAAALRDQQKEIRDKMERMKDDWARSNERSNSVVTAEDVADIVSMWTGVPVSQLTEEESQRLLRLEDTLHKRVIGQHEAVTSISKAIRRGRVGLKDKNRPIGSFIFLGPTGVGKTELTKALAEAMFGDEKAMIRFDMSEYMQKFAASRLIGSPPGYVGYEEGGQLTEAVRTKPYSVVLFDEIEKAHPDVFNILLQILEDGRLTDSQGKTVDFKNTVIIMTSNVGARLITEKQTSLGFGESSNPETADFERTREMVMGELKKLFRPEFLNRVDDIIVFHKLTREDTQQIAEKMLQGLVNKLKEMDINLSFTPEAVTAIADKGFDPAFGARPLRRVIQNDIEDAVSEKMLEGAVVAGKKYSVSYADGAFSFAEV